MKDGAKERASQELERLKSRVKELQVKEAESLEARESLRKADNFNRTLLATIPFGMEIVDEKGMVLFINKNLREMFGDEAVGKKCWELYRDDKQMCPGCPLRASLKIGETATLEVEDCLNGRTLQITHTGMEYQGGPAVLEIFQDATERKRIDRMKSEFVGIVSHELRTPLTSVREGISQVLDGILGETTGDQREVLQIALDEVDRLARIINNILDISRIEAGKIFLDKTVLDFNEVVKKTAAKYEKVAAENGVGLRVETAPTSPRVSADSDKLEQILVNLIGNALKFTPAGGEIVIRVKRRDASVECSVADSGVGISAEGMDRIFDKFTQLSRPVEKGATGAGLGLAITRELVHMHGGEIRAESLLNRGSTFTFKLPLAKVN